MELLIANPFFSPYPGGTEKMLLHVGSRLSKKHSVTVLTAQLNGTSRREEIAGMDVIRLPSKIFYSAPHPIPPPVPIIFGTESWLRSEIRNFDVVHINNRFIFSPAFGNIVAGNSKSLCLTIHNSRPAGIDPVTDIFGSLYDDVIAMHLMRSCHGIAGVSDSALYSTIPKDFSGVRRTIYNGVDAGVFSPGKSSSWRERLGADGKKLVMTNVRLVQQKGVSYLIDAMKGMDAELVVFGRGPLRNSLERKARASGIKSHFVSEKLSDPELASLYRAADCFVMPSLYDPCPLALLEAMGCGLPCVVTDAGGMKEIVQSGKSGVVVPAANADALSTAIKALLDDSKHANSLGRNARERVISNFTWDKVANEYAKFYSELCG